MPRSITQRQLRNDSDEIMRAVEAGETIVVTRNGVPTAELRPLRRRTFVPRADIIRAAVTAPRIDGARFRSDVDAVLDPKPAPELIMEVALVKGRGSNP